MNEIEPRARLALELARSDAEPSATDKLRVLQALQARLGTPPLVPATAGERGAPQAPAASAGAQSSVGVGKILAVGAVAALLGLGAGLALRGAPPVTSSAPPIASTPIAPRELASVGTAAPIEPRSAVAASLSLAPSTEPAAPTEPASAVTSRPASKPASSRARSNSGTQEPELFHALELLRRAQRALRKQEAALSLALLDELDQRFTPGVLGEERQATRVLALCLSDDEASARQIARTLLEQNPATIYAARVRESCAGPEQQSPVASPNAGK
jgi:hypothetical protein